MNWRGLFPVALLAGLVLPQSIAGQAAANETPTEESIIENIRIECTPAWYAKTLIGKQGCIAGRLYHVRSRHNGDVQLSLCPEGRECVFRAVVKEDDRDRIGDLSYLRGKVIAISGEVVKVHDAPRIIITDREQIKVAPGNPPVEFDAAHHRPRGKVYHEKIPPPAKW